MNKKQVVLIAAIIAFIAGLIIISAILNNGNTNNKEKSNTIKEITEDQFEELVLNADKPVLVDFYADWCGPCKVLSPTIEELAQDKKYSDKYYFYKVNVDSAFNISERYSIQYIPTIIVFKDGTEITRSSGVVEKDYIVDMLKQGLE
ncbi:MAG: thioredoxin [Clostridia bacterium]|nr:thioredoxin [Clostridia bacterium]